ncbi:MAG TPA: ethanolamine ammonia-lyase reactivating factor EutA, partial [Micromonosporaceae bacterium]
MHIGDVDHEHDDALDDDDRRAMERAILAAETLQLLTVGIDIGSSTAHLLFARVFFQRQAHRLSDRFVAVNREVVWRSPILLTPFRPDGTIDADELSRFVDQCYRDAGIAAADVDSGAVILTGEAIKRRNARSIDEIFAGQSGRFVCATAGHRLEAILAGHGSGATALSRRRRACGLHVDIGGGTTKLALIDRGEIVGVAAFAIGGRLLAQDPHGAWTRIDESAVRVATDLGLGTTPAAMAADATRTRIVQRMAELVVDQITRGAVDDLGRDLELTDPLERTLTPEYITFSGGVAEYILGDERREFGDIARPLAAEIVKQLRDRVSIPTVDIDQRIRATVIGASQFTVQLSGKTVHIDEAGALPLRNVPVVRLARPLIGDIDPDQVADTLIRHA